MSRTADAPCVVPNGHGHRGRYGDTDGTARRPGHHPLQHADRYGLVCFRQLPCRRLHKIDTTGPLRPVARIPYAMTYGTPCHSASERLSANKRHVFGQPSSKNFRELPNTPQQKGYESRKKKSRFQTALDEKCPRTS